MYIRRQENRAAFHAAAWVAVCFWAISGLSATAAATDFWAGAASATVNPPLGSYIAGDALNRQFESVHDDLYVKAAVISDGETAVAIVVIDCLGLTYPHIMQIRASAAKRVDSAVLDPNHIVVSSTHTHCGPDVVGIYGPDRMTSGLDPAYMEQLVETAATQIAEAAKRMRRVTARYGETVHGAEWVRNICEPEELDSALTVVQFLDGAGQTVCTLTNFACHPTILDGVHNVVSSDYVGGFYRKMAAALPGEHLFLQGAIGGWVQPVKGDRSFALADRYGAGIAAAVLGVLEEPTPLGGTGVQFASAKLHLPFANDGWRYLLEHGVIERDVSDTLETEIAWFRIGDAQFATHPGETPPAYSLATKALMGTGPRFVLGLTQDALGYILKPEYFTNPDMRHAGYLTSMSLGPETGPRLMDGLAALITQERSAAVHE